MKKRYVVGTPESIFTVHLFSIKPRKFSKQDVVNNLTKNSDVRIFNSHKDACNYARSLRICRPSHIASASRKKFAPVIMVNLSDEIAAKIDHQLQQSEEIVIEQYDSIHHNFSKGQHRKNVHFNTLKATDIDWVNITIKTVEFPDSPYAKIRLDLIRPSFF